MTGQIWGITLPLTLPLLASLYYESFWYDCGINWVFFVHKKMSMLEFLHWGFLWFLSPSSAHPFLLPRLRQGLHTNWSPLPSPSLTTSFQFIFQISAKTAMSLGSLPDSPEKIQSPIKYTHSTQFILNSSLN